jgi:hypothetical protein
MCLDTSTSAIGNSGRWEYKLLFKIHLYAWFCINSILDILKIWLVISCNSWISWIMEQSTDVGNFFRLQPTLQLMTSTYHRAIQWCGHFVQLQPTLQLMASTYYEAISRFKSRLRIKIILSRLRIRKIIFLNTIIVNILKVWLYSYPNFHFRVQIQ